MTLSATVNKVTYTGNGATTSFAYTFPILHEDDIVVVLTENGEDTEVASNLFSVTGVGTYSGGAVTYPLSGSPIASSVQLTILRRVPATQETDLTNQSTIYPEVLEQALDRIVMIAQQNAEKLARALIFSVADSLAETVLPAAADRAGKYLTFDEDGNPAVTEVVDVGSLSISSFWTSMVALSNAALSRAALGVGVTGTLGQADADTILGNPTGSTADPSFNSLVSYLARINNTRGAMLRRGSSSWEALALGTSGHVLGSDGTDLTYFAPPIGEGLYRNLAIDATADTTVTVTADWITLANASNSVKLVRNVNATIATGSTGANGLDTGSMASNTWYAVWIIYNPTTDASAALLSTSASSPTLPSGYTFRHRVGWVRTQSASSALRRTRQRNTVAQYVATASIAVPTLTNGTITVVGDHVPNTATMIHAQAGVTAWQSTAYIRANSNNSTTGAFVYHKTGTNGLNTNDDPSGGSAWIVLEASSIVVTLSGSADARVYGWMDSI